ncbi:MAG TPA: pilin [Candidatus Babeliales bacterium]|nr:pilin [Candidatus Babeliales bacterium]
MKETPPGCLDINRDTRAGEEKFDSCSAEKVLSKNNAIVKKLNEIVDFLSAGVALVIVGSIIFGGVQYAMAGGSPEAVGKAKERITNAVIALVVYIFIFSFLQWIIPGGIFNS